ncbi:MAG: hypothetical protein NWS90_09320 [Algoriphagus sp.]|uniref:hypothetical protein n=1 Tax=Algoriphagus sp. TaxID=1872435 RepID=UPI002746B8BE|nr:hypothetical protein [Algoriphagus sp.]
MDYSAADIPVGAGQLAGQAIHPNQGGGCRKKPKNPSDIRQTGLPPSSKKVLFNHS